MSKQVIEALSPAKLNLFLHVTGQRANGYHELQTAFQLLDWGDRMHFEITDTPGITLHPPVAGVPNEDNLIFRAAAALGLPEDRGVAISIEKVIPMGGGLGGGSSNAAVTLLALNDLFDLGHSVDELAVKGAALGADVPVFVRGTSAWAEGVGDELTPLELPTRWFVIIYPDCHVSTQEIFGAPELTRNTPPITVSAFFEGPVRNDLQPVVESRYEQVSTAIKWLSNHGSAMMTGSGACVFASFQSQAEAQRVAEAANGEFSVFVAKGINRFTVV
ncbi:MAG: 4-(cytidine 5'-diphospho)-2-C-methyl-D-erythritol kinase [Pseudomonadota bacterium]|nr:4-(cytidine 5'-diphospho)-2-C-methyl-D-erythritol kinase [Pseudomonadota bacterium]MEC7611008.1 4-(cytidine 5'-diphospho)-2-C-methyl-D-erythritol kinase [Pseudomonadota bacterium]MEC8002195.1 4-(cytidine 5'-diphospho)-2-C-methyl-D-erythritol kinase [Pseudomonadota bacterium]MEC8003871.1 4-(cytidine 5'-diphospho)-2-C-methyl-D-erythritol kinase [Pseudomonadota bacterium]MEC8528733.1 4-(cytidine 5'-diphospho)-2-C-methyl-D-erythritol kinase [Pseudomonadota bacterium]